MGWAIKRADETYRAWFRNAKDEPLRVGEVYEELAEPPTLTPDPITQAELDTAAQHIFDNERALKALALTFLDVINNTREAAGQSTLTAQQLRNAFLTRYKALG